MDAIFDFISEGDILSTFLKLFGIIISLLYVFFSVILVKQVDTMKKTVSVPDQGLLKFIAYLQVGLSLIAVAYALFIL